MLLARVFGNRLLLLVGTPGKELSDTPRERTHIRGIELSTPFGRPLPRTLTGISIREAFLFRPRQRFFFDEHTLSFVAFACATETDDDGAERRVAACASGERGVAPLEKHQMIEISARQTQWPFCLQTQKAPLAELLSTFTAG
jgi:hypothetical protein